MANTDITLNCLIIPSGPFNAFSLDRVSITITVPRNETAHFKLLFKTSWHLHIIILPLIFFKFIISGMWTKNVCKHSAKKYFEMESKLELLEQRISELEAENTELRMRIQN
ncbi:hypothetical protein RIR_jg27078.t1 [Rhizophagus irregularis DAOM 181602=DAOM 197198]|nr:hypothetical protein RIR_jg27078.t1 [Rhizophagus irregularis DAOM 181602=DAOM 197198]